MALCLKNVTDVSPKEEETERDEKFLAEMIVCLEALCYMVSHQWAWMLPPYFERGICSLTTVVATPNQQARWYEIWAAIQPVQIDYLMRVIVAIGD